MTFGTARAWARMGVVAMAMGSMAGGGVAQQPAFGPANPFYAPSTLPYEAPPLDKVHDADFEPAFDAGIAEQRAEIETIANDAAAPTFDNTLVAMERNGQLLRRVQAVFGALTSSNTNPTLQSIQKLEAPKLAALQDAMYLNTKLFARIDALYAKRAALKLDPEQARLLEVVYQRFEKAGAKLNEADKAKLKEINKELSVLSTVFTQKLLAGTKNAAFRTEDKATLDGLSGAQIEAAAQAAKTRGVSGYVLPLQNTTQQPDLAELKVRATREKVFENSWMRNQRGGEDDTRATILRLAELRQQKAKLLGYPNFAAWTLQDQMAKTPANAEKFLNDLVPVTVAKATREGQDIQALMNKQGTGAQLEPWDWEFYAEHVRKQRYNLDANEVKPYFELNRVIEDGVFYAAHELYGITFKERHDIPVYTPDMRVWEVFDADGQPLALFYGDYFKRDNKNGGAWCSSFVSQSKLLGRKPVVYNVLNLAKPAPGQPALIGFDDVRTLFHEFGHALHAMFSDAEYPGISGTGVPRDFVEFPSQFNEHWATEPRVFAHYARHFQTGAAMPAELIAKLRRAETFNQGYGLGELLAAAQLDMQWHTASEPVSDVDAFEKSALERVGMAMPTVPPRYRSSYFQHIWSNGYAAGYYAYLWSEMLDDSAYVWFEQHGGMTRANGDRLRKMVLSRGNTEDLETMFERWNGAKPSVEPMLRFRGLTETADSVAK